MVTTPETQWAYAAEIPQNGSAHIAGEASVWIEVDCEHGAVGIALLDRDGSNFLMEMQVAGRGQTVVLTAKNLDEAKSIVIRNTSTRGASTAVLRGITVGQHVERELTPIVIDEQRFERFGIWKG